MKILGIIPARYNSTRFPGKPLAKILGKPMIQWVYERSRKAEILDNVVVATDSDQIFSLVESFGGDVVLTSPDHPTGLDRVIEVSQKYPHYTHYLNIQGDEPAISEETINRVGGQFSNTNADITTAAVKFKTAEAFKSPDQVKVVFDKNQRALYFSRSPIPSCENPQKALEQGLLYKHLGIYGYSAEILKKIGEIPQGGYESFEKLEQLRFLEYGIDIYVAPVEWESVGVDRPEDIQEAERLLTHLLGKKS